MGKQKQTICFIALLITIPLIFSSPSYASSESDAARKQAEEILSDKRYGKESKDPLAKDVERIGRWLGENSNDKDIPEREEEQIREQTRKDTPQVTPPSIGGLSVIGQIILFIAIGLVVLLLGYLIYRVIRAREKKNDDTKEDNLIDLEEIDWTDEQTVLEIISDADQLEALSQKAELEGHFDIALRYRFRAGLLRLNSLGMISFHPSITNAQWQLALSDNDFDDLTKDFNDITYGEYSCNLSHVEKAKNKWQVVIKKKTENKKVTL